MTTRRTTRFEEEGTTHGGDQIETETEKKTGRKNGEVGKLTAVAKRFLGDYLVSTFLPRRSLAL